MVKAHQAYRHSWFRWKYSRFAVTRSDGALVKREYFHTDNTLGMVETVLLPAAPVHPDTQDEQVTVTESPEAIRHWLRWLSEQMECATELSAKGFIGRAQQRGGISGMIGSDGKLSPLTEAQKELLEKKQAQPTKEKYYKETLYQIYRSAGYSIDESIQVGYSPLGAELMRYLSDDKRHPLNRREEDTAEEESSALPERPTF